MYSNAEYLIRNNSVSPCAGAARATPTRASFALSWRLAEICKKTRTYKYINIYDGELYIVRYDLIDFYDFIDCKILVGWPQHHYG